MSTAGQPDGSAEVGAWSLSYLGPGFRVQLRISKRARGTRVDGFMSPAAPATVLLLSQTDQQIQAETSVTDSGRFEFSTSPTGPCRLIFLFHDIERQFLTPPFWL